jgi:hypothetical protein
VPAGGGRRSLRELPGSYCFVEAPSLHARLFAESLVENLAEPLVLEDRLVALSREGEEAHESCVRLFSGRLLGRRLPERFDGRPVVPTLLVKPGKLQEQRVVRAPELFPLLLRPRLVDVFG